MLEVLLAFADAGFGWDRPGAAGHRAVHGAAGPVAPERIAAVLLAAPDGLTRLDPLHRCAAPRNRWGARYGCRATCLADTAASARWARVGSAGVPVLHMTDARWFSTGCTVPGILEPRLAPRRPGGVRECGMAALPCTGQCTGSHEVLRRNVPATAEVGSFRPCPWGGSRRLLALRGILASACLAIPAAKVSSHHVLRTSYAADPPYGVPRRPAAFASIPGGLPGGPDRQAGSIAHGTGRGQRPCPVRRARRQRADLGRGRSSAGHAMRPRPGRRRARIRPGRGAALLRGFLSSRRRRLHPARPRHCGCAGDPGLDGACGAARRHGARGRGNPRARGDRCPGQRHLAWPEAAAVADGAFGGSAGSSGPAASSRTYPGGRRRAVRRHDRARSGAAGTCGIGPCCSSRPAAASWRRAGVARPRSGGDAGAQSLPARTPGSPRMPGCGAAYRVRPRPRWPGWRRPRPSGGR